MDVWLLKTGTISGTLINVQIDVKYENWSQVWIVECNHGVSPVDPMVISIVILQIFPKTKHSFRQFKPKMDF